MASLTWVTLPCLSFLKQARNSSSFRASSVFLCSSVDYWCASNALHCSSGISSKVAMMTFFRSISEDMFENVRFGWLTKKILPGRVARKYVDIRMCRYTWTRSRAKPFGCRSSNRSDWYVLPIRPMCGLLHLNQKSPSREGPHQGRSVLGWSSIGRPARSTSKHHRDEGRQEIRVWR
jgi:hypothetical protein